MIEEGLLDGDQQVIGQNAQKDVSLDAPLELVEDRPLTERAFHVTKCVFDTGQQDIKAPSFFGREVFAVGLEQVGAVEAQGALSFSAVLVPAELLLTGVIVEVPVAGDSRVAFFEPPERFVDFLWLLEPSGFDPRLQALQVSLEALFLLEPDGLILGLSALTTA